MAKRKRATGTATRTKSAASKKTRRPAAKRTRKAAKAASRKSATRKATKKAASREAARKRTAPRAAKRTAAKKSAVKSTRPRKLTSARKPAAARKPTKPTLPRPIAISPAPSTKKPGARSRRVKAAPVRSPIPSSLGLIGQGSSAARSGREELREHLQAHTETGPAMTAGDLDANWALAYSSGDEAPGGDNPTPDQDVVDDIGHALGIEYGPTEELRGANKVEERDKHRWELDPASAEDYGDRRRGQ
jgi:hypothetical protein